MKTDILIVGVGGQGTLLASVLLGNIALKENLHVKLSEVHGMAQRGGSVVPHVRISDEEIASPVLDRGCADIILSFEMLEAVRALPYLKKGGKIYVNTQKIMPMPVITGAASYPEDIEETLAASGAEVHYVQADALAEEAGNMKTVNTVMLGALSSAMDLDTSLWEKAIEECVRPQFIEVNKKALALGRQNG
ncbi:MAG: indolepyruvate oxidoreductase subunit beta [Christensenellaceae bacterium]|nr:indolepyruvate oxidoreductase subunit beta [Christensenellaceae bacterium]